LGKFWKEHVSVFLANLSIFWKIGLFYCCLVYVVAIWSTHFLVICCIFPVLVSGNPAQHDIDVQTELFTRKSFERRERYLKAAFFTFVIFLVNKTQKRRTKTCTYIHVCVHMGMCYLGTNKILYSFPHRVDAVYL
jgi:hypothetical protein